ncbi:MAG TPA: 6-aminohexanoate hydrolase [Deltaproteobacteria bacterium]|nr:6-aminohexanoate hydrolase [Deltaproteobacteria bacterium]
MTEKSMIPDASTLAESVRSQARTPEELLDEAILSIERENPELNAVVHTLYDEARARIAAGLPDGPFRGVPILLKDLDAPLAGAPFHCGTRFLRDLEFRADTNAYFVDRLLAAGFVPIGKTNTPELGLAVTTEPLSCGASRNPWNPAHSTGGSSGGAAAAVAGGLISIAHASDGGGSIRIPASACGLVGLKPSRGRVSLGPDYGSYWQGFVTNHVVTRSVRDTAAVLDVVSGLEPGDPYTAPLPAGPFLNETSKSPGRLRIGLMMQAPGARSALDPACVEAVRRAGQALESLGHQVEESHPEAIDQVDERNGHFTTVVVSWTAAALAHWEARTGEPIPAEGLEPLTVNLAEIGKSISAVDYLATVRWCESFTRQMAAWWENGYDLLVTPTLGTPPPPLGTLTSPDGDLAAVIESLEKFSPFVAPFNMTGQPAVSLPLHQSHAGLPIGVQCIAPYAREDLLLQVAAQLETAMPWADRRPAALAS